MKPSLFYRVSAALLLLFAVGHTLGFRNADPAWGIGAVLEAMQSKHFDVQGFSRTYWDFFLGAGFTAGVLYFFAAVLAWQLGSLPDEARSRLRVTAWGFVASFAIVTVVSWLYLFWIPVVMSTAITICLGAAAWVSRNPASAPAAKPTGTSHAGAA